ncbi:MAG TPA: glycosyltransferase, partial [Bacillota bacterium]|nr:glycosyltransferase [Bacillota bacterium]
MINLARGFSEQGLEVDLVLAKAEGPYLSQVPPEVRVIDLDSSRVLTSLPGLVRYLRCERPRTLLSTLDHANIVAIWARKLARVPNRLVVRVASNLSESASNAPSLRGRLMPRLVQKFYPLADTVVAVSQGVANDLTSTAGLQRERIQVIYNPVVTADLFEKARESLEHPWFVPGEPP